MRNNPQLQPSVPHATLVKEIQKEYEKSLKTVKKGVLGKYQKKREAEINGFENTLRILEELGDGNGLAATREKIDLVNPSCNL